jgi:hypothetical protein
MTSLLGTTRFYSDKHVDSIRCENKKPMEKLEQYRKEQRQLLASQMELQKNKAEQLAHEWFNYIEGLLLKQLESLGPFVQSVDTRSSRHSINLETLLVEVS